MLHRKYAFLLEYLDIRRWYENVARGSTVTADVYLRRLDGFSEIQKLSPKYILSRSDRTISSLLMDFVSWREKHGDAL